APFRGCAVSGCAVPQACGRFSGRRPSAGLLLTMTAVTATMSSNRQVEAALRAAAPADDPAHPGSRQLVHEGAV
ncbi:hypothetical protein ACFVXQ_35110, partial [Kitasatospora sp. NPDC058263]